MQDMAVRFNNRTLRLVREGDKAALFGAGEPIPLTIVRDNGPGLADFAVHGVQVTMTRVARPCSCRGGVWKEPLATLSARLEAL